MTTQQQIQANLIALGFDNASVTAIYNQIAQAIGLVVDSTLTEINDAETIITDLITAKNYGKSAYYTDYALAFQYGDNLVVDTTTLEYIYATVDSSKQIVSQAAFEEIIPDGISNGDTQITNSQLYLKVATTDTSGNLVALNSAQLTAFKSYMLNFQIPGLPLNIVSKDGNVLSFMAQVSYYKTYDYSTLQTNVSNAITTFRQSFAFDGELYAGDLQDYMKQNVPGIRDFYIYNVTIDGTPISKGSQKLTAGYFNYVSTILDQISYGAV